MATSVVALFEDRAIAEAAAQDLMDAGFLTEDISIVARDDAGERAAAAGGLLGLLVDLGMPDEQAQWYAEGIRRGGVLVAVRVSEDQHDRARMILRRYRPVDIAERAARWRESGWSGFDAAAPPYTADEVKREREGHRTRAA